MREGGQEATLNPPNSSITSIESFIAAANSWPVPRGTMRRASRICDLPLGFYARKRWSYLLMKPLVAIVGRPNVGKSTLFNKLVGERLAIVEDIPGTTRDRIYADAEWNGRTFTVIDTGGLELDSSNNITSLIASQAQLAIEEADVIIFLVDSKSGITAADREVADMLRRSRKPIVLGANKADNLTRRQDAVEFYELGLGEPITLSSLSGTGTGDLLDAIVEKLPPATDEDEEGLADVPKIAIVGRPNTGKSSLVNAILGQERVIVSEIAGTTRDTIDTMVEHK